MNIVGLEYFVRHLNGELFQIKIVANDKGAVFGPVERQHVELVAEGIQYRPDGKGNAIAGMIYSGRMEFRNDNRFSEGRLRVIISAVSKAIGESPELSDQLKTNAKALNVFYAGIDLS